MSIIGSGVVGSATGQGFHKLGHEVIFYDISKEKIRNLKSNGYNVAIDLGDALSQTDISFVCVNTPTHNSQQDLSQILSVLYQLANYLNTAEKHHLLVFRSTMLPGTMRSVVVNYLEKNCTKKRGVDYDVVYNPEFLRQNSALDDFFKPDRVIIGEDHNEFSKLFVELYQPLTKNIITTSFEAAELIKYASNCFLSLKISFFNEIGLICKHLGIDDKVVSTGVSLDKRIGKYGTEFGRPFDGMCLPKDTQALASFIKQNRIEPDLLEIVLNINKKIEDLTSTRQLVSGARESHS
ncbi:MAG: UDP-glucose/GDP-mannose dehydrogenase family protein [Thaumarchaeota archaeon]|nr:MAG: UDP-glucose/GDP-mannose dehydrogenase family protein [Nitrososphaerota archaeon]TLX85809.1 MAG: UDP-glucose/GDP-mannose dehydrogenase family protein [Nitrososphaerota archaeon]TLX90699.1 MAG: UDP-glucose/GDP-mannose dehydrogenase family protein [Nitrososphaerota archaeon]